MQGVVYKSAASAALGVARHGAARTVGQLPPTLHEVQQEQVTVRTKAEQIDAALKACGNLDLLAQWRPLRDRAAAYAAQEFGPFGYLGFLFVTPNDLEAGKQLERDLAPWFKIAAECRGKLPPQGSPPPGTDALAQLFGGAGQILFLFIAWELLKGKQHG